MNLDVLLLGWCCVGKGGPSVSVKTCTLPSGFYRLWRLSQGFKSKVCFGLNILIFRRNTGQELVTLGPCEERGAKGVRSILYLFELGLAPADPCHPNTDKQVQKMDGRMDGCICLPQASTESWWSNILAQAARWSSNAFLLILANSLPCGSQEELWMLWAEDEQVELI